MVNGSLSALGLASFKLYDKYGMYVDKGEVRSLLLCVVLFSSLCGVIGFV